MSDNKYDSFDDLLANLEKLRERYSDYGDDYADDNDFSVSVSSADENIYDYADEVTEKETEEPENYGDYYSEAEPVNDEPEYEEDSADDEDDYAEPEEEAYSDAVYLGTEDNYSKEKKAGNKKKKSTSSKVLTVILSLLIALIIWGALFAIDYVLVSSSNDPFFCIKTQEYDNGSKDFTGLFYKYQLHVENNGATESVCLPWFMKGPNDGLEKLDENSEKADSTDISSDDLMPLEITIPAEFIEEDTTKGLKLTEEQKKQGFKEVKLNKDGSATYKIQKGNYRIFLAKLKNSLCADLNSLAQENEYPSIKKVEFTNDLSSVTLYVEKEEYIEGLDHFIDQSIFEWVGRYKSFANQIPACDLIIKDITDNSVIEESKG